MATEFKYRPHGMRCWTAVQEMICSRQPVAYVSCRTTAVGIWFGDKFSIPLQYKCARAMLHNEDYIPLHFQGGRDFGLCLGLGVSLQANLKKWSSIFIFYHVDIFTLYHLPISMTHRWSFFNYLHQMPFLYSTCKLSIMYDLLVNLLIRTC